MVNYSYGRGDPFFLPGKKKALGGQLVDLLMLCYFLLYTTLRALGGDSLTP